MNKLEATFHKLVNSVFRKPYRFLLTKLTLETLEKHRPNVIAVMGDGQTSIARETIYYVIREKYPARRNLESPEAEFSIPLTILGYPSYPKTYFEWFWLLFKVKLSLNSIKPYKHFLVLELNFVDGDLLDYWLKIIKPETALIVGGVPVDYGKYDFEKVVKIHSMQTDDILGPYKIAVTQIGRFYKINSQEIDKYMRTFSLPSSKIRYFPGENGSFIIDATHYYFPIKLEAVLDLVDYKSEEIGKYVIFTDSKKDKFHLKRSHWIVNPKNYVPERHDLVVIRGKRINKLNQLSHLFVSHKPIQHE